MAFEWDPPKARANRRKHGVDFADVTPAFEDPFALTTHDPHPEEARLVTVGADALGRVVVVVYTWRGEDIRIISARKATARECRAYETRT